MSFFVPCPDPNHEAFGQLGSYESVVGVCMGVDVIKKSVKVDDQEIYVEDIAEITIIDEFLL